MRLPEIGKVTISNYMSREVTENSVWEAYPCIMLPRVMFGDMNSTSEEITAQGPDRFDPKAFHTLQCCKHECKRVIRPGKLTVDATRFFGRRVQSPHNIMEAACNSAALVDVLCWCNPSRSSLHGIIGVVTKHQCYWLSCWRHTEKLANSIH